jgi:hypothetical protein
MAAEKKRERKIVPEHMKEAQAMTKIGRVLDGLQPHARERVVAWTREHYGTKTT